MGLNDTPRGDRIQIAVFGPRNAGKSSLINALTGQDLAIVSDKKGTTTDPVYKAMELLPLGPVMMVDTPGLDDDGELGELRIKKAMEVLRKTDIALLVEDASIQEQESNSDAVLELIKEKKVPYIIVRNKIDLNIHSLTGQIPGSSQFGISAKSGAGIKELKDYLASFLSDNREEIPIIKDLLEPEDLVVLIVPIDKAAPKGRLILPQQQTIREILDVGADVVITNENGVLRTIKQCGKKPKMVVTDSQVFQKVEKNTPKDILLTSFSILFARHKGNLKKLVESVSVVETLKDTDKVLVAEGCTHHRQCEDIGTVKIPKWLCEYTKKELVFETSSGNSFPEQLDSYRMILHCGGCMLNEREMKHRIEYANEKQIPIVNYGILIAYLQGILKRSLEPFPEISCIL